MNSEEYKLSAMEECDDIRIPYTQCGGNLYNALKITSIDSGEVLWRHRFPVHIGCLCGRLSVRCSGYDDFSSTYNEQPYDKIHRYDDVLSVWVLPPINGGVTANVFDWSKSKYDFNNWTDSNKNNPRLITVSKDIDLTANCSVTHYTITYNSNFTGGKQQQIAYQDVIKTISYSYLDGNSIKTQNPQFKWANHKITRWYFNSSCTGSYVVPGEQFIASKNVQLYAKWTLIGPYWLTSTQYGMPTENGQITKNTMAIGGQSTLTITLDAGKYSVMVVGAGGSSYLTTWDADNCDYYGCGCGGCSPVVHGTITIAQDETEVTLKAGAGYNYTVDNTCKRYYAYSSSIVSEDGSICITVIGGTNARGGAWRGDSAQRGMSPASKISDCTTTGLEITQYCNGTYGTPITWAVGGTTTSNPKVPEINTGYGIASATRMPTRHDYRFLTNYGSNSGYVEIEEID